MRKLDSKTFAVDTGLDLVLDDCGHPYYAIVSTREGDPEWSTQQIEKALGREGYKVWCDTATWYHARDFSTVQLREDGYHENAAARAPRIGSRATIVNPDHRAAASLFEGAHVIVRGRKHFPDEFEVEFLDDGPNWTKGQKGWIAMRYVSPERQRKNGDVLDRGWRFRKTRTDPTWGPIPDMRTEGPIGKAGTVYEFNIKLHHELIGLSLTDDDLAIESDLAVQGIAEVLRESYPWISEVYQSGRSGGWLAIKDADGKAREKSLREISEFIQEEKAEFARELKERYGAGHRKNPSHDRELWLCQDCTIVEVNDDPSGIDSDERVDEVYAALHRLKLGGHISPNFDGETGEGEKEFSSTRCDCCGTRLAGARFRFAQWDSGQHTANASSYYVWPLNSHNEPLAGEGPFGPYSLDTAKTTARIRATKGKHDYAVTRGSDPQRLSFTRLYRAGTGKEVMVRAECQNCGKDPGDELHCQHCGHSTATFID